MELVLINRLLLLLLLVGHFAQPKLVAVQFLSALNRGRERHGRAVRRSGHAKIPAASSVSGTAAAACGRRRARGRYGHGQGQRRTGRSERRAVGLGQGLKLPAIAERDHGGGSRRAVGGRGRVWWPVRTASGRLPRRLQLIGRCRVWRFRGRRLRSASRSLLRGRKRRRGRRVLVRAIGVCCGRAVVIGWRPSRLVSGGEMRRKRRGRMVRDYAARRRSGGFLRHVWVAAAGIRVHRRLLLLIVHWRRRSTARRACRRWRRGRICRRRRG